MRFIKTLVLLSLTFLFASESTFRGKDRAEVLSGPIPLAYCHLISEAYNIPLGQLNIQRGSYLIITPDNMVSHLDEFVSFKKSQGFNVSVKTLGEIGTTAADIKDAITETIMADPMLTNPDWLGNALIVAGNYSNTVPIPITPKWTSYWVRDLLLDEGYASVDTVFYPPTQQGSSLIQNIINNGVGIVNYRGWGDANGWHYPEFHVSDIAGLNNGWMTPVFTSFVCNSNDFANNVDPCLGEALVRAGFLF